MPVSQDLPEIPVNDETQPKWLTKTFLQNKMRIHFKDPNLEVVSMILTPASAKGENYASVMTRVSVQYTSSIGGNHQIKTGFYIVKSSFESDEFSAKLIEPYGVFKREMEIYEKILPKINALLQEVNDTDKLFPECIAVDYDHSMIILEDISQRQFFMCDRQKGLDIEHAKLCLKKLAKMHAASAVLNERELGIVQAYDCGMFNRYTNNFSPLFVGLLEACAQVVGQWDGYEHYAQKLLALKPKIMEYGLQVFEPIDSHINVLTHGDFWINNAMFNEQAKDVMLIDFQFSCWASPAVDLHYFLNTSLTEELRLHRMDELFQYYYQIFVETLKALKFQAQIPSLHRFLLHMAEKNFYAFTSGCLIQAIHLADQTEDADFQALMAENERARNFKRKVFENKKIQENLRRLIPMFDRKGLLDNRDY